MTKVEIFDYLSEQYEKYQVLSDIFQRLCLYYRKKGSLPNTLQIKNIAKNDRYDINHFFGNDNVNNKYINVKKYLEKIDRDLFVESLFKITGIEKNNTDSSRDVELKLLLRLKLIFPELVGIHEYLNDKLGGTFLNTHTYEQLNKACEITSFLMKNNDEINDLSTLGAMFCNDSHLIRKGTSLYNLVGDFLYNEIYTDAKKKYDRKELFDLVGIAGNPTSIKVTVFAPLVYLNINGIKFDWIKRLWECGESATLSLDNINSIESCFIEMTGMILNWLHAKMNHLLIK